MRVLVVDDCHDAAVTMALLLKQSGHEAVVAHGGQAALEQALACDADAIFIDLAMPDVDGLTVAEQLRKTANFADIPLVAVSGYSDAESQDRAMAAGFTDFLAKPYALPVFQGMLERLANRLRNDRKIVKTAKRAFEQARVLRDHSLHVVQARHTTREMIPVTIAKSGIACFLTLARRTDAEELRRWLKVQRCRVGPVFAPDQGQFALFVYSKRASIGELIEKHGAFRVQQ